MSLYRCWNDCLTLFSNINDSAIDASWLANLQHQVDADDGDGGDVQAVLPRGKLLVGLGEPGLPGDDQRPEDIDEDRVGEEEDDVDLLVLVKAPACKSTRCRRTGRRADCSRRGRDSRSRPAGRRAKRDEGSNLLLQPLRLL